MNPRVDKRDRDRLILELENQIENLGSKALARDENIQAIHQIMARFVELCLQKLNQKPQRTYQAFLEGLSLPQAPPLAARVPLSFALAEGALGQMVPASTQVAGQDAAGEPVIFEIENELALSPAKLVGFYSLDPKEDSFASHGSILQGAAQSEALFVGREPLPHRFWLGLSELIQSPQAKVIQLRSFLTENLPPLPQGLGVQWSWQTAAGLIPAQITGNPAVLDLREAGELEVELPVEWARVSLLPNPEGEEEDEDEIPPPLYDLWLRADLKHPMAKQGNPLPMPALLRIEGKALAEKSQAMPSLAPDACLLDESSLDISMDFYPLGEAASLNRTFALSSLEAFAQVGTQVEISFLASTALAPAEPNQVALVWEYFEGKKWQRLTIEAWETLDANQPALLGEYLFVGSAKLRFQNPGIPVAELGGQEGRWIRVRLAKGRYGTAGYTHEVLMDHPSDANKKIPITQYVDAIERPPLLSEVKIHYLPKSQLLQKIVRQNGFELQALAPEQLPLPLFAPLPEPYPALYFGFDQALVGQPQSLFFPLENQGSTAPIPSQAWTPPTLVWEYWSLAGWERLLVEDGTRELADSEIISFVVPTSHLEQNFFEQNLFWVRVRLTEGSFLNPPRLRQLAFNAVWANQWETLGDRVLGSGQGRPFQKLRSLQSPILPGQELWVKESSLLAHERLIIRQEEGLDAIQEYTNPEGENEIWVRWHEVTHFHGSDAHSRHYRLDRTAGLFSFGSGQQGMLLPKGVDNVMLRHLRVGGGQRGNLAAKAISELLDALPSVDGVHNPIAAEGGRDGERYEDQTQHSPRKLKTHDRAITQEDYEWLAQQASPSVARAKCLPNLDPQNNSRPGFVTLVVVPQGNQNKPMPSAALLAAVKRYLLERAPISFAAQENKLSVIAPRYLRVSIGVTLGVQSVSQAKRLENQAISLLRDFLHPTLGAKGKGLDFGQTIFDATVYEVLERLPGVEYVGNVTLNAAVQMHGLGVQGTFWARTSFPEQSPLVFEQGRIQLRLLSKMTRGKEYISFRTMGFMEEDLVELRLPPPVGPVKETAQVPPSLFGMVRDVQSNPASLVAEQALVLHPQVALVDYPVGTWVLTPLRDNKKSVRSYLTQAIARGTLVEQIFVALPRAGQQGMIHHRDFPGTSSPFLVDTREEDYSSIAMDENYLAYSGQLTVQTQLAETSGHAFAMQQSVQNPNWYLFDQGMESERPNASEGYLEFRHFPQKDHYLLDRVLGILHVFSCPEAQSRFQSPESKVFDNLASLLSWLQITSSFKDVYQIFKGSNQVQTCPHCIHPLKKEENEPSL